MSSLCTYYKDNMYHISIQPCLFQPTDDIFSLFTLSNCYRSTYKTSTSRLPNKILIYLGVLLHSWLFAYRLVSHISSPSNLSSRLLVILYSRNCLYTVFLVIYYTTTVIATVLTTVRCDLHLKVKVHRVGSDMHRV